MGCILMSFGFPREVEYVRDILRSTRKGREFHDERGRAMAFPTRRDYIDQMTAHGLISSEADFVADDRLVEAVYLDWLLRPQVGCVFAQLLARPVHRTAMRTEVIRGTSGLGGTKELASTIGHLVEESIEEASIESLSVLMPQVTSVEKLTQLVWELGHQDNWTIELESLWQRRLVRIGLRVKIAEGVLAETLGMGPFEILPATRRCPITTLEIRTKPKGAVKSPTPNKHRAAHLAYIPIENRILKPAEYRIRSKKFTPALRKRILGKRGDSRAKAAVTYSVPVAIWSALKVQNR